MENPFDKNYWEQKYIKNETGWDIGAISSPLKAYFSQLTTKNLKILIPGAGNSYEAEYLHNQGFKNVDIIDIAAQPLKNFKNRVASFPKNSLIETDFFKHNKKYNLIVEHTFFCALHPDIRTQYVNKMADLLEEKGKLIGLLFDFELTKQGPPFGGSLDAYIKLFSEKFNIIIIDKCYNSIKPRLGRELFFIFEKKQVSMESSIILTNQQINNKTRRIAYQIYEDNCKEKEIIIAGINGNGYVFAQKISNSLLEISDLKVTLCEVFIDKKHPLNNVTTSLKPSDYKNKSLIIVDDVLNSGTTLIYGIKHFLEVPLKSFSSAVLVDRNHKKYPVKADYKGISLSTSMHEHISVLFEDENSYAILE